MIPRRAPDRVEVRELADGGAETTRRLTPTERLHEVTMAVLTRRPAETEHNVELSRNARGIIQFGLNVRGPDIDAVIAVAVAKFDFLAARYPYPASTNSEDAS